MLYSPCFRQKKVSEIGTLLSQYQTVQISESSDLPFGCLIVPISDRKKVSKIGTVWEWDRFLERRNPNVPISDVYCKQKITPGYLMCTCWSWSRGRGWRLSRVLLTQVTHRLFVFQSPNALGNLTIKNKLFLRIKNIEK